MVRPERTLTLALPKTGLQRAPGELYVADIGIPPEVFRRIGVSFKSPFGRRYWVRLDKTGTATSVSNTFTQKEDRCQM